MDLILHKCNISITYQKLGEELSTQVIVFTVVAGGFSGYTVSWFTEVATLAVPSVLATILFTRSLFQQISNYHDYLRFNNILERFLDNPELQNRLRAVFIDGENGMPSSGKMEMEPLGLDTNTESASSQNLDQLIKLQLEKEYGLIENPSEAQLEKIISDKLRGGGGESQTKLKQIKDFENYLLTASLV